MAANVSEGSGSLVTGDYISNRVTKPDGMASYEARLECDFNTKCGSLILTNVTNVGTGIQTVAVFTPNGLELREVQANGSYTVKGSATWQKLIELAS